MGRGKRKPRSQRGTKRKGDGDSTEEPSTKRIVPTAPEKDTTGRRHKRIYEAKGVPAEQVVIARRTVTSSMDAILKKLPRGGKKEAAKHIEYRSKGAGYLMPNFSTFMNHAINVSIDAEDPIPEDPGSPLPHDQFLHEDLCDQEFHRRVMYHMAGKSTSGIRDGFKLFLDNYMTLYPVSQQAKTMMSTLDSRNLMYLIIEWFTSFKKNIILNYETRFIRMFYDFYRPAINSGIKKGEIWKIAKKAYELCIEKHSRPDVVTELNAFMGRFEWFTANDDAEPAQPETSEYYKWLNLATINLFHTVTNGSNNISENASAKAKLRLYIPRMKKVRKLSSSLQLPGYRPRLFTMAPECKWKHRFVAIDNRNASTILKQVMKDNGTPLRRGDLGNNRCNLKGIGLFFDLYGESGNHWTERSRPAQTSDNHNKKRKRDKVLLKGRDKRRGLHQLRPDAWATELKLTPQQAADPTKRFPSLADVTFTDGIQVKVVLSKVVYKEKFRREPPYPIQPVRPRGTYNLDEAGYNQLTEECDITRDKTGIYGKIKKLDPLPPNVRMYGCDPGQKELVSIVAEDLPNNATEDNDDAFELANHERTSSTEISSDGHARRILRTNADNKELHRRRSDQEYRNALASLNNVSLRDSQQSHDYVAAFHANATVMANTLIETDRRLERFARLRANQREFARLGKRITYLLTVC